MSKIADFQNYKKNREDEKNINLDKKIIISIIKAIEISTGKLIGEISEKTDTKDIFSNEKNTFEIAYASLVRYWGIEIEEKEIPEGKEFENYPNIGTLFNWLRGKIREK